MNKWVFVSIFTHRFVRGLYTCFLSFTAPILPSPGGGFFAMEKRFIAELDLSSLKT
jgi:hypothetical protein